MDQPRARLAQQQAADAGVAEQVEHVGIRRPRSRIQSHCGAMSGKKPRCRNGVSDASNRTPPRDSSHCARHRPVLDPAPAAFLVGAGNEGRVGIPVARAPAPTSPAARAGRR